MSGVLKDSERADRMEPHVRCFAIAERTYWSGVASFEELSSFLLKLPCVTDASPSIIRRDVLLLHRHGFPIEISGDDRCRIRRGIPGFSARLTRVEASVAGACSTACYASGEPIVFGTDVSTATEALGVLRRGLREHHPGSEILAEEGPAFADTESVLRRDGGGSTPASGLVGVARQVHRRLSILDLLETMRVQSVEALALALGQSDRSVHGDLAVLRRSGIGIRYSRRLGEYRATGLNKYLSDHLTVSMAAALLLMFETPGKARPNCYLGRVLGIALQKLANGIRSSFGAQDRELNEALAKSRG